MKKRNAYVILGFLALFIAYVIIRVMQESQQEAFVANAKSQLKYISLGFFNYKHLKGKSLFNDAVDNNMSWRVLLSETFRDELMYGDYNDILSEPTPDYLRDPRMPVLLRGFSDNDSSTLTSFRATQLREGYKDIQLREGYKDIDGKVSHWIVAFLPMDRDHWTSKETVSEDDFKKMLSKQNVLKTPVYIVTESEIVMEAEQFMTKLGSLK